MIENVSGSPKIPQSDEPIVGDNRRERSLSAAARNIGSGLAMTASNQQPPYAEAVHNLPQKREQSATDVQELTSMPRERRFPTLQDILASTPPDAGVLNKLIDAYGHIPLEHRPQAREAITNWAKLLPDSQTGGRFNVSSRLDGIISNLTGVDAFHSAIARIMTLKPENRVTKFQQICWRFGNLPQAHRVDAFDAILDKTERPTILQELARVISELPKAHRCAKLHALLDKTEDPETLGQLAEKIYYLPNGEMSSALKAILLITQDPQVLQSLAHAIPDLPEKDRSDTLHALLDKIKNLQVPGVLQELPEVICHLPKDKRLAGLHALLKKTKDPETLKTLVWNLTRFSPEDRYVGWNAILGKTNDWSVIKDLETTIRYLPKKDQDAATQAIRNARNPFA